MHEFVICDVELEIVRGVCGDVVRIKVGFHLVPMFSILVVVVMVIMMIVIIMVMIMVLMCMILIMLMTVSTVVMMIFIVTMSMIMFEPMVVTVEVLAVLQERRPVSVPVSAVTVSPHHLEPRHHGEAEHDGQGAHQPRHPVPAQLVPRQHLEEGDV